MEALGSSTWGWTRRDPSAAIRLPLPSCVANFKNREHPVPLLMLAAHVVLWPSLPPDSSWQGGVKEGLGGMDTWIGDPLG